MPPPPHPAFPPLKLYNQPTSFTSAHPSSHRLCMMSLEYPVHVVKNPLVLLVGCSEYGDGLKNLPGVKVDIKVLYELFYGFYGWTVKSIESRFSEI